MNAQADKEPHQMDSISTRKVFSNWWPLAASWLFMGIELPMISAVMARLADPKIHLAAYGGVVFPLALIIEAPIIMLLAASTALSKDWASYLKLFRFMMWAGGSLTLLHFLVAFTPLYDPVVVGIMGPPAEIVEPARLGLMIMLPWTWSIAYRRFHQGVLIRFGRSKDVSIGTAIRLLANATALTVGVLHGGLPGIVVGTIGIAAGVIAEAVFIGLRARPVVRGALRNAPAVEPALTWQVFYGFYIPLAMTSLLNLIVQPMGSAAVSRMPLALDSLAVWPVVGGFAFMLRSLGFAYNEVTVALLDERGSLNSLRRFMWLLTGGTTLALLLIVLTPLADVWFITVSGLDPELATLAKKGMWVAALWPGLSVMQNWYQGVIVHARQTWAITESVAVFMGVSGVILGWGVSTHTFTGLYVGLGAFVAGTAAQVGWLWFRSKKPIQRIADRDGASPPITPEPTLPLTPTLTATPARLGDN